MPEVYGFVKRFVQKGENRFVAEDVAFASVGSKSLDAPTNGIIHLQLITDECPVRERTIAPLLLQLFHAQEDKFQECAFVWEGAFGRLALTPSKALVVYMILRTALPKSKSGSTCCQFRVQTDTAPGYCFHAAWNRSNSLLAAARLGAA